MLLLLPTFLLAGCDQVTSALDTTPSRIELSAPSGMLFDTSPVGLMPRVVTAKGKVLTDRKVSFSVVPVGVAGVDAAGNLTCAKSGDASIVATGGGLSATVTASCRLVAKVEVPPSLALMVGDEPEELSLSVKDSGGAALTDVQPTVTSSAPDVVNVVDGRAVPLAVGNASLRVVAGTATAEVPVQVIKLVNSQPLTLEDGGKVQYVLPGAGRYRLDVRAKASDGSAYGVQVAWGGAPCAAAAESTSITQECQVADGGSFVIYNPTGFGWGPSENGSYTVYAIP